MPRFIDMDDLSFLLKYRAARESGDVQRVIEARLDLGHDPIEIAADIAAQEG